MVIHRKPTTLGHDSGHFVEAEWSVISNQLLGIVHANVKATSTIHHSIHPRFCA